MQGRIARCINRNIVECKVLRIHQKSGVDGCINRNIVECKEVTKDDIIGTVNVLIETLWNVKMYETVRSQLPPEY